MFNVMLLPRLWRPLALVLALVFTGPPLSAVVVEGRWYRGQRVQCLHGGGWLDELGLGVYSRARLYEKVFTGTVQSVVEVSVTDKRLRIVPDEVFLGEVAGEVTATVNQACLTARFPEIKAGDKWVFYLRTKMYLHPHSNLPFITTDGLIVVFDSPSKPVAQAGYDLCLLRLQSDSSKSCFAAKTAEPDYICGWDGTASPAINPFPRDVLQMPKTILQPDGVDLTTVTVPPELHAPDSKSSTVKWVTVKPWPWPQSCSPQY